MHAHLIKTHAKFRQFPTFEPWYGKGRQHDWRSRPNKYNVVTIPDNAANSEREMRSQQTDSEEGHTATDVRPHKV